MVRDLTKQRLKMLGRQAYFAALFIVFAIITWDATVGARRPGAQAARPASAHELSCDLPKDRSRSLQLLGKLRIDAQITAEIAT